MTFSVEEMMEDLRQADASGDTELAQHIAGLIREAESKPKGLNVVSEWEKIPGAGVLGGIGRGIQEMRGNFANNMEALAPKLPTDMGKVAGLMGEAVRPGGNESLGGMFGQRAPEQDAQAYEAFKERHPYSAEAGRLGARTAPAMVAGANIPLAAGMAAATDENPLTTGALTGLLGYGGKVLGAGISRIQNARHGNTALQQFDDVVDPKGVLRAAQERGYRFPKLVKDARGVTSSMGDDLASKHPWTRGIYDRMGGRNQGLLQQDIAKSMGTTVDDFSDDGLKLIRKQLDDDYKYIAEKIPEVKIPKAFYKDLKKILGDLKQEELGSIIGKTSLSGDELFKLRSVISKKTTAENTKHLAMDLMESLDDAMKKSVPKTLRKAYDVMRERWQNWYSINRMHPSARDQLTGEVAAKSLSSRMSNTYRNSPPGLLETQRMKQAADAMGGVKSFQHSPGTAEQLNMQSFLHQAMSSVPPLLSTARLGAANPAASAVGAMGGAATGLLTPQPQGIPEYLRRQ